MQLELESHTIHKHSPFSTVYMFRFSLKMFLVNFPLLLFLPVQCSASAVLALCLFVTSRCSVKTSGQIIFLTQRLPLTYHRQCVVETGVHLKVRVWYFPVKLCLRLWTLLQHVDHHKWCQLSSTVEDAECDILATVVDDTCDVPLMTLATWSVSHWVYAFGCSTVCVRQHIVQFHPWQADGWYLLVFININISVTFVNLQYWAHHGFYPCDKVLALGTSYSQVSVSVCLSQVVVQLNWLDGLSWFFWHGGFLQPVLQCVWTKFRYLPI